MRRWLLIAAAAQAVLAVVAIVAGSPALASAVGSGQTAGAATPSPVVVIGLLALVAVAASIPIGRRVPSNIDRTVGSGVSRSAAGWLVLAGAAAFGPTLLPETTVYKLGLVLILLVGAIGLHVLVAWVGQLSLAHASLVGLPAFVVAKVSADHDVSPILLLPLGVLTGVVAGGIVGIPAIRAKGLQVAVVTLAAGVAIDRFFFTKSWLVGAVGSNPVATPALGPLTFTTSRALYPVVALAAGLAVLAAWAIHRSSVGRALLWIKAQPDAAAAFGIPVTRYRAAAYAVAGGFAGLGGGLTTVWVGRLTPEAFPVSRSFTYLIIVALAGRGFVGGVAAAAAMVEGGQLFLADGSALITYAAPIGLIFTLTRHPTGLNGLGRSIAHRARALVPTTRGGIPAMTDNPTRIRPLLATGLVAVAAGFGSIWLAWYHAGNTSQVWIQNQEMILGGIGGLALVIVGVGLVVHDRLLAARAAETERWQQLVATLSDAVAERRPDEAAAPAQRRRPLRAVS